MTNRTKNGIILLLVVTLAYVSVSFIEFVDHCKQVQYEYTHPKTTSW